MLSARETIMLGVKEDCEDFIQKFAANEVLTYTSFTTVWRSMQFQNIYCGRPSVIEMTYFTEQLFDILILFTSEAFTKAERVCAVYMLYALYFIQPLKKRARIRIEKHEWEDLWFFINGIKRQCKAVAFCFFKLFSSHAFDFTLRSEYYTIERARKRVPTTYFREHRREEIKHIRKLSKTVMDSAGIDEPIWTEYENSYNNIKQEIEKLLSVEPGKLPSRNFLVPILRPSTSYPTLDESVPIKSKTHDHPRSTKLLVTSIKDGEVVDGNEEVELEEGLVSDLNMPGIDLLNMDEEEDDADEMDGFN